MVAIPNTARLSGKVKAVPSGDTIVVMNQKVRTNGPPLEMRLTLSSLKAPLLSRDGSSDEPFAWASREFLRTKLIGQTVSFHIDYRVPALSRIFATVYLPSGTASINLEVVEAGLSRVRRPAPQSTDVSPEFDALCAAEEKAALDGAGLHGGVAPPVVRHLPSSDAPLLDGEPLVAACRDREFRGIVEYVANGSALKIFLQDVPHTLDLNGDRLLTVCLSGVQCPGFRRAEGDDQSAPPKPMPFAVNARFHTEIRLLNREVKVCIEGVDRNGVLFASVEDPSSSMYIGEELLRAGFAKTVGWSLDLSSRAPALRAAERFARDKQLGVWKGFQAPAANTETFTGKCVEIVSGDMIVVLDDNSQEFRRISLASVRAARLERPTRDRSTLTTGPASDAKESLRKKLIGRRVRVEVEYIREPSPDSVRRDVMVFATVSREGDNKNDDVALAMITNGLLSVVRHRGEEDRAAGYEDYLEREAAALEAKRGLHAPTPVGSLRVNNLTGPDAKKRSRDVLSGLQRGGPYKGIVEFVSSATRFRVFLPSESMLITLALRAVRSPQPTRRTYGPDGSVREEVAGEPHGDQAANFAKEHFMQRDVEVEVNNVDRIGAFLGNMYVLSGSGTKTDVSYMLLECGHGYLHESFDASRDRAGTRYLAVEKQAKDAKRGAWSDYEEQSREKNASNGAAEGPKRFVGIVSEIGFGGRVFVQNRETTAATLSAVKNGLAALNLDGTGAAPLASMKQGMIVAAKFSHDQSWYRARVLFVHKGKGADVRFVDYGNEEHVEAKDLRTLGSGGLASAPGAAIEVGFAHTIVPAADDGCGVAAGEALRDMIYGKEVTIKVVSRETPTKVLGDVLLPTAGSSDSGGNGTLSIREHLLHSGLARIIRKKDAASVAAFKELRPFEEVGIASRQYLWNYGEAFESDCDEETN